MELRVYWAIVAKRAWVVIGLTVLALAASLAGIIFIPESVSHTATVRLAIRPESRNWAGYLYTYDDYYAYLASEFLNDDMIAMIETQSFLNEVRSNLQHHPGGAPFGSIRADKKHRVLTITAASGSADGALALASAAADVLSRSAAEGKSYFGAVSDTPPQVTVVDPPALLPGIARRVQLDLALRGLVGLMAGIALAFLLDYIDDTVRDAPDAERVLGVAVIGEVPTEKRAGFWKDKSISAKMS